MTADDSWRHPLDILENPRPGLRIRLFNCLARLISTFAALNKPPTYTAAALGSIWRQAVSSAAAIKAICTPYNTTRKKRDVMQRALQASLPDIADRHVCGGLFFWLTLKRAFRHLPITARLVETRLGRDAG